MPLLTVIDRKSVPVDKNSIQSIPTRNLSPLGKNNIEDCMKPIYETNNLQQTRSQPIQQSQTFNRQNTSSYVQNAPQNYQQRANQQGYQTPQYQQTQQQAYQPVSQPAYQAPQSTYSNPRHVAKPRRFGNGQELRKGQKVNLPTSQNIKVCVGWDVKDSRCDVDISSFMLNDARKVLSDDWFVFYGMTTSPDGSCVLNVNGTSNDDKCVDINMTKISPNVTRIIFVLTIDEAIPKGLNFSMIKDAYIRILDNNNEIFRFALTDYYENVTSMMLGEIYKHNGAWKFAPIGDGVNKDLAGLCAMYGVQTD